MFRWFLGQKEKPKLNYIWIGHPPLSKENEHTVSGQDVKDVLAMAKACKNPIYFYCLEEYAHYYENMFSGTKVKVQAMETYLRKMQQEGDREIQQFAEKIMQIKQIVLTPPRGKVIDFVSIKEVFSLFLLATQGGYTVDSNIHPAKDTTSFELTDHPHFKAPYTGPMIEIWMMYASPKKLNEPRNMLRAYLAGWDKVQKMLTENPDQKHEKEAGSEKEISSAEYPKLYHQFIIDLTVGAVESVYTPSLRTDENWSFTIDVGESTYEAKCKGIPVEKSYGNSHKHDAIYAKNKARFDLDHKSSFLETLIKKQFEKPSLFNSMQDRETLIFEEEILRFIKLEENRVPEKIIEKLEELGNQAQERYGTETRICGFKNAVNDIIAEYNEAFQDRVSIDRTYGS